ncbi:transcriptional regulator [Acidihalobacter prosperus]|uniref:Transcriptional regulator n=2 Tax=Acidihalobacter prosperus TaxID=160660 RepID=A0A1A6C2R2_9GAMM|nr:transcriptional regulator [Acidihalobacter prosperus]
MMARHALPRTPLLADSPEDLEQAARILKSMAHPMRLKLICALGDEEFSVKELLDRVGTTPTNISQHLGILLSGGLVTRRRRGNRHFYRIGHNHTLELIQHIRDIFCPETRRRH